MGNGGGWGNLQGSGGVRQDLGCAVDEVFFDDAGGGGFDVDPGGFFVELAAAVGEGVGVDEEVAAVALGPDGGGGEAGEGVAGDVDVAGAFEEDAGAFVDGHGGFAFGGAFVLAFADVRVAEGV